MVGLAFLLVAHPAAAGKPKLTVVALGLDFRGQEAAGALEYTAEQAVARSGRFEVVRLVDALDTQNATFRATRQKEAEAAMQAGLAAYDELDTVQAAKHFSEAAKAYEQTDLARTFAAFSKAWVMRIASLVANGETRAAAAEVDELIPLDPRAVFSPNYFPPDSLKKVEAARKAALAAGSTTIEVKTRPSGAQVYLNGQFKGLSPLVVQKLPAAQHRLTIAAPGYALLQQRASPGLNELTLRPVAASPWQAAADRLQKDPEGPGRDAAAAELGRYAGAEQVLVILARQNATGQRLEVIALRLDSADGHNFAFQTVELARTGDLAVAADPLWTALLAKDEPRRGGPVTHFKEQGPVSKKTLGYALLGGGGALLVSGLVFGLQAQSANDGYRRTSQLDPRHSSLRSSGQTYALVADLGTVLGLAAAGAGGYFAFFSGRGKAEPPRKVAPPAPREKVVPRNEAPRVSPPKDDDLRED